MPYVERVTKAGNTIEIERYFTSRYKKKGISRGDKVKPTKEEQEKVNTRQAERKLRIGRTVVLCDYVASYSAALTKDTIFAFLFNFKDYVLNTNYSMGVKKYEDNDTDDQITKGIMLVDGKVVDKNSLVVVKKIEAV